MEVVKGEAVYFLFPAVGEQVITGKDVVGLAGGEDIREAVSDINDAVAPA